jgi:hypothetical protein
MEPKATCPHKKLSTATSLAAFITAPELPPLERTSLAREIAGNFSRSGDSKFNDFFFFPI